MTDLQLEEAENPYQELQVVKRALQAAGKFGLEAEVVSFALDYMKANPKLTHAEALSYALAEWDL